MTLILIPDKRISRNTLKNCDTHEGSLMTVFSALSKSALDIVLKSSLTAAPLVCMRAMLSG